MKGSTKFYAVAAVIAVAGNIAVNRWLFNLAMKLQNPDELRKLAGG